MQRCICSCPLLFVEQKVDELVIADVAIVVGVHEICDDGNLLVVQSTARFEQILYLLHGYLPVAVNIENPESAFDNVGIASQDLPQMLAGRAIVVSGDPIAKLRPVDLSIFVSVSLIHEY